MSDATDSTPNPHADITMTLHLIDVPAVKPQPWRNGGGQTRELLVWPATGPWQLRISRADIDRDGAFSAFDGVKRWFAVLHGAGVSLQLGPSAHTLRPGDAALSFDGAQAPDCRLIDGPTQDLNLMAIGGDSEMTLAQAGVAWHAPHTMRGLYSTVAGHWQRGPDRQAVAAHHLLWDDAAKPGPWRFDPQPGSAGSAWWLGFTPQG